MEHPILFHIGSLAVPSHFFFEALAYAVGFRLFLYLRKKQGDALGEKSRTTLVVAAVCGAALGSKLLHHLNHPQLLAENWQNVLFLMGGKTIVGALLGGLLVVECTKWMIAEPRSSGDLYALPLCVGTIIGRIGCHLSGLADDTFGQETSLFWGIDFGDGVVRHPTALYEICFLTVLAGFVVLYSRRQIIRGIFGQGLVFKLYLTGYLGFRLLADFMKPYERPLFLTSIQWACVLGLLWALPPLARSAKSGASIEELAFKD